jgi:hypothetical protein
VIIVLGWKGTDVVPRAEGKLSYHIYASDKGWMEDEQSLCICGQHCKPKDKHLLEVVGKATFLQ